jgi:hypothetical protein
LGLVWFGLVSFLRTKNTELSVPRFILPPLQAITVIVLKQQQLCPSAINQQLCLDSRKKYLWSQNFVAKALELLQLIIELQQKINFTLFQAKLFLSIQDATLFQQNI